MVKEGIRTLAGLADPGNNFFRMAGLRDADVTMIVSSPQARPVLANVVFEEGLSPEWLPSGDSFVVPMAISTSVLPEGRVLARLGRGGPPIVTAAPGNISFGFDPIATLNNLLRERYFRPKRPATSLLPFHYHRLPAGLRFRLHKLIASRGASGDREAFPAWPVEPAAEAVRWLVSAAAAVAAGAAWPRQDSAWPEGKRAALILSHDIDTAQGLAAVRGIADMEERMGLRSCWAIVGKTLCRAGGVVEGLVSAGHEIALHGYNHDTKLAYLPPHKMARRLDDCAALVGLHGIRGFRSPALLTSGALDEAISGRFDWSSSTIDTDIGTIIGPRRGVCSIFPFFKGRLVEIPVTLPMDDKLLAMGIEGDAFVDLVLSKVDWIASAGGVAHIVNHAEPHLSGNPGGMAAYGRLLDALRGREDFWFALPSAVADHWRSNASGSTVVR